MTTRAYRCAVCGKVDVWSDSWSWYGSMIDEECGLMDCLCSSACRAKHKPKKRRISAGDAAVGRVPTPNS